MSQPKVSIVVPVYNAEKYIERCVESLKAQTLKEIEIILIDDGSPDSSPRLCDEFGAEDPRIKVIHQENAGGGMARNAGISAAQGEYIGFVDSDDYVSPVMYENLYNAAKKNDAGLVISGLCFVGGNMFNADKEVVEKPYFEKEELFDTKEKLNALALGIAGNIPEGKDDSRYGVSVCKTLFRAKELKENGIVFLSERRILSEDALMLLDFVSVIKTAVGECGAYYFYCRNEDSISKSYDKDRLEKVSIFIDELEARLSKKIPKNEYGIYLDRLAQAYGRVICSQEIMEATDKKIKYRELKARLSQVCKHPKIAGALKKYPIKKLPVKQGLFAFAMKFKLYFLMKCMVSLRDK